MRFLLLSACLIAGVTISTLANATVVPSAEPPLSAYGKLPAIDLMSLSASGRRFAFISQDGAHRQLFIRNVGGDAIIAEPLGDAKVRNVWWAGDDLVLVSTTAAIKLGYDNHLQLIRHFEAETVLIINLKSRSIGYVFQPLTQFIQAVAGDYGERLIDGRWYGFYGGYDGNLYRVDLDTNSTKRVATSSRIGAGWVIGPDGAIAARAENNEQYRQWRLVIGASGDTAAASKFGEGSGDIDVLSVGRTPGTVLVKDQSGDKDLIEEYPLTPNASPTVLFDSVEPSLLLYDPNTNLFVGATTDGSPKVKLYDPALQARYGGVLKAFPGVEVTPISFTANFNQMIVLTDGGNDAGTYWFIDLTTGKASELAERYPDIRPEAVGPTRLVSYKAQDGLALEGVLTLPAGRIAGHLPLVVLPHGGPIGFRDKVGFDWWAQGFASKGYAVFQPNFRGSSGYGPEFRKASHGEWGRKMQTDISDGVAALAVQGVIDPKRVCIVGGSYGGYASSRWRHDPTGYLPMRGLRRRSIRPR